MWASVTYANAYMADGLSADAWAALTSTQRAQALTSAFRQLSSDPLYSFPTTATAAMMDANCEFALWLYSHADASQMAAMQTAGVDSFRIGQFSMSFKDAESLIGEVQMYPATVLALISPYRARLPGMASVVRDGLIDP